MDFVAVGCEEGDTAVMPALRIGISSLERRVRRVRRVRITWCWFGWRVGRRGQRMNVVVVEGKLGGDSVGQSFCSGGGAT